jgi:hypothetical protein
MVYRVDAMAGGQFSPDIAGATILAEALQSFTRLVVTGAYDEVRLRDDRDDVVVAEWRRHGVRRAPPAQARTAGALDAAAEATVH